MAKITLWKHKLQDTDLKQMKSWEATPVYGYDDDALYRQKETKLI